MHRWKLGSECSFLALFIGTVIMGWIGSFHDQMTPATFWALDAAIALTGALLIMIVRRPLSRALLATTASPRKAA